MVVQRRRPFKAAVPITLGVMMMMMVLLFLLLLSSSTTTCNGLSSTSLPYLLEPTTTAFTTASGIPVSRYGLGGAARSIQPSSLPSLYYEEIVSKNSNSKTKQQQAAAPFYFYYNPNRYPKFMNGIKQVCTTCERKDIFVASGGTDRSPTSLDQRLNDCLK